MQKKKLILFAFIFFTFLKPSNAQVNNLLERAMEIYGYKIDSAIILTEQAYKISLEKNDLKYMARAISYRGFFYNIEEKLDSALLLLYKAETIQESIKDTIGLITTYRGLGIFYWKNGQSMESDLFLKKAYKIAISIENYLIASTIIKSIGINKLDNLNFNEALLYYTEAERLLSISRDSIGLSSIWQNKAVAYKNLKKYDEALKYAYKVINNKSEQKSIKLEIVQRTLITNILLEMHRYNEAEKYALEALEIVEKTNFTQKKEYVYKTLGKLYYAKKIYKKAYVFNKKSNELNDSLLKESRLEKIAEIQHNNKLQKKEIEINTLKLKIEKNKNTQYHKERINTRIYIILATLLIGIIILFVIILLLKNNLRLVKLKNKLLFNNKKQMDDLVEKEHLLIRESHHRIKNNLQFINSILYLQSRNIVDTTIKNVFLESRQRIQAISLAHQNLYGNESVEKLNMHLFLEDLIQSIKLSSTENISNIIISPQIEDVNVSTEKAIQIGIIVNEVIRNALKYAFKNIVYGKISINLSIVNNNIELIIEDNGNGMEGMIKGNGLGFKLIKSMNKKLNAEHKLLLNDGVKHIFKIPII